MSFSSVVVNFEKIKCVYPIYNFPSPIYYLPLVTDKNFQVSSGANSQKNSEILANSSLKFCFLDQSSASVSLDQSSASVSSLLSQSSLPSSLPLSKEKPFQEKDDDCLSKEKPFQEKDDDCLSKEKSFQEKDDDCLTCIVCMDAPRMMVFRPCNHFSTCLNCSKKLKICPTCNAIVQETIKIFIV